MVDLSQIQPGDNVIGADGVHIGTIDHVDGDRLKLTRTDSADGQHHYIDGALIADVDDGQVKLSYTSAAGQSKDDEATAKAESARLDEGLEETFPASDPVSAKHIS